MGAIQRTFVARALVLVGLFAGGCPSWDHEEYIPEESRKQEPMKKSEMKNPWARAKVGDYYILSVSGGRQMKVEVVKAGEVEVLVRAGEGDDAVFEPYNLVEEEDKYVAPEDMDSVISVDNTTMEIGGRTIQVKIVTRDNGVNRLVNTYSDEMPLDGIVRSEMNEKVHHLVIDFRKN